MAALEIVSDPVKAHSSTAFTEAEALQVDFPSSRDRALPDVASLLELQSSGRREVRHLHGRAASAVS